MERPVPGRVDIDSPLESRGFPRHTETSGLFEPDRIRPSIATIHPADGDSAEGTVQSRHIDLEFANAVSVREDASECERANDIGCQAFRPSLQTIAIASMTMFGLTLM